MAGRRRRSAAGGTVLTVVTAFGVLAGAALAGASPAGAAPTGRRIAPGVTYRQFDVRAAAGTAHAHLLTVDLADPHVRTGLLYPGAVAARATVSRLADSAGAVAGVNGDFFHITETQHPGVEATGAAVGPAVADGRVLKAAVPKGQRFGPALPPGTDTREVFGVGTDRRARLDRLTLTGSVGTPTGKLPLKGLNQYALPVNSVGAFTARWGSASRMRAVCGTDTRRSAPCSDDTYEVKVRGGRVVSVAGAPGSGSIPADTTVLVGREEGARALRALSAGDRVDVTYTLAAASSGVPYAFAIGGFPVLRGGAPLSRPGRRYVGGAHGRGRQGRRTAVAAPGAGRGRAVPHRSDRRGGGGHHAVAGRLGRVQPRRRRLDGDGVPRHRRRRRDRAQPPQRGRRTPRGQRHRRLHHRVSGRHA
ncbi:hypothetical protein ACE1SV_08660 [Streptomyces sp. E-15]